MLISRSCTYREGEVPVDIKGLGGKVRGKVSYSQKMHIKKIKIGRILV